MEPLETRISLDRRAFVAGSLGLTTALALRGMTRAAQATPSATGALPELRIMLTDTGFEFPQPLAAGRYAVVIANTGTSAESHTAIGKIPDRVTDAQYEDWLTSLQQSNGEDGETDEMSWDDIEFVGPPDWPPPGGEVIGVVDVLPGRYFLFDASGTRGYLLLTVDGAFVAAAEPLSDVTVTLREMAIDLPDAALTSKPVRWKIENTGAMTHEVAVLSVTSDFTEEVLHTLLMLPEDATPPPDLPEFVYQPVAAIGLLGKQQTSWLDVQLQPGHYLAVCMSPFGTGYPHAVDGMYRFFDVK
jgi:hypothetical protein